MKWVEDLNKNFMKRVRKLKNEADTKNSPMTCIRTGNGIISEVDRDNIRGLNLRVMSNMSRHAFNQIRFTFRHKLDLDSLYVSNRRLAVLSGVTPLLIDCCVNSCIAYTRQYQNYTHCPYCREPRRSNHKARRQFTYLPLGPRLQGFFWNPKKIHQLDYRGRFEPSIDGVRDVFDLEQYKNLCNKHVSINGVPRPYKFFEGKRDIAMSLCMDGFLLFGKRGRRNGPSATPIVLQIYNLPPNIRTHLINLVPLGSIPGPNQPRDWGSYLAPVDDELVDLANGIPTYDSVDQQQFMLRAYLLYKLGDMQAINHILGIRGHNAFAPCRSCHIKGCRNATGGDTNYYVPLNAPRTPGQENRFWDPENLPMRSHNDYVYSLKQMADAPTEAACEVIGFNQGLREAPLLRHVNSLDFARSVPWDFMHMIMENICPLLVDHWTGKFKNLNEGSGNYQIASNVWDEIGAETAEAVSSIPSAFVRVLPDIAKDRSGFTAESWCFWFLYLAPTLLKGRFLNVKYYRHLCSFVNIIKTCLRFSITHAEIDDLETKIVVWVQEYEKYVYPGFFR